MDIFRTPGAIDTTSGDAQVDVTLEVTDDLSGFSSATLQLRSPSGSQSESVFFNSFDLDSGDALNGIYTDSLNFDQFKEGGLWEPFFLNLYDDVGNLANFSGTDLDNLGFNLSVAVNVPEPSALTLVNLSVLGLLFRKRGSAIL